MLVTSGFNFEGYRITRYLGFFSGETALGTGVFSEFFAGAADLFGTTSTKFADKLETAKNYAITELEKKAQRAGANAIIGLDVDYNMFMSNLIGVIANGTAVCVEKIEAGDEPSQDSPQFVSIPVVSADLEGRVRPVGLRILNGEIALEMVLYSGAAPSAVLAEVSLESGFGETVGLGRMEFMKISAAPEDSHLLLSCFTRAEKRIPASAVRAEVRIVGSMDADPASELRELRRKFGRDAICPFLADKNGWRCVCGTHNPPQNEVCALCGRDRGAASRSELTQSHVREAQGLANAADILRYVSGLGLADTEHTQKLLQALQSAASAERVYGNNKTTALRALEAALDAGEPPARITCPSCGFTCTRDYARARKKCPDCGVALWKEG